MTEEIRFNHIGPQYVVKDVADAVTFYSNSLGFAADYLSGEPLSYAVVFRDEVYLHLCLQQTQPFKIGPGCAFIAVRGVEKIYETARSAGVEIVSELSDHDYGQDVLFKTFTIKDPDKNVLRIGEPIK